eukprot:scaffold13.g291.t1
MTFHGVVHLHYVWGAEGAGATSADQASYSAAAFAQPAALCALMLVALLLRPAWCRRHRVGVIFCIRATVFIPQAVVEAGFWADLGSLKLHTLKLGEGPVGLQAHYSASSHADIPGLVTLAPEALLAADADRPLVRPTGTFALPGQAWVLNTVEQLKTFDRKAAVQRVAAEVWAAIQSGAAERHPSLLQRFLLLAYCDLKHYKYFHWLAFPALQPPAPYEAAGPAASLGSRFEAAQAEQLLEACSDYKRSTGEPACLVMAMGGAGGIVSVYPLSSWATLRGMRERQGDGDQRCFCWHRPFLLLAASFIIVLLFRWGCEELQVLCLRERRGRYDAGASVALRVRLPRLPRGWAPEAASGWQANARGKAGPRLADLAPSMDPQLLAASAVDLNLQLMRWRAAPALDVTRISRARCLLLGAGTLGCAVARTLLGWGVRRLTFVDNSRVAFSNPVRQSLYAFADCLEGGRPKAEAAAAAVRAVFPGAEAAGVQLSIPMPGHPVGGAAEEERLRVDVARLEVLVAEHDVVFLLLDTREARWLPTLLAAAHGKLAINAALGFDGFMVMRHGCGPPEEAVAAAAVAQAARGADAGEGPAGEAAAREGAAAADAGEAATGGGTAPAPGGAPAAGDARTHRLGCYFCNDVVAPLDSTVDRTLDQQCTVARPGLSSIAGALAVELMAAVLQHPTGAAAPPPGPPPRESAPPRAGGGGEQQRPAAAAGEPALGEAPHMVRGQLGGFSQMQLTGQAFAQCTACSATVVAAYRLQGHDFVLQGLRDPRSLEDLTGLSELHHASEAVVEGWSESEGEEEGGDGRGDGWEEL